MLVVAGLRRHTITLMRLAIHALLSCSCGTAKRTASIATLIAAIAELVHVCEILLIISTDVVKHRTIPTIRMVTYLVQIRRIIGAGIIRVSVRVSPRLARTLSLLLMHLLGLLWRVLLVLRLPGNCRIGG